jgi:ABC-type phosphate transport system permease subunit
MMPRIFTRLSYSEHAVCAHLSSWFKTPTEATGSAPMCCCFAFFVCILRCFVSQLVTLVAVAVQCFLVNARFFFWLGQLWGPEYLLQYSRVSELHMTYLP